MGMVLATKTGGTFGGTTSAKSTESEQTSENERNSAKPRIN
jgi:hypothetical protein